MEIHLPMGEVGMGREATISWMYFTYLGGKLACSYRVDIRRTEIQSSHVQITMCTATYLEKQS